MSLRAFLPRPEGRGLTRILLIEVRVTAPLLEHLSIMENFYLCLSLP